MALATCWTQLPRLSTRVICHAAAKDRCPKFLTSLMPGENCPRAARVREMVINATQKCTVVPRTTRLEGSRAFSVRFMRLL
ncbi:MAG: hypothetical protein RBG13Loki_2448 [Promethearchaeota archaeon CR_4]|nr:MAG: hypothetical protein RBG13Loki_2448 [Candidatus Lokiarchaeota archaeon CR_4]